MVVLKIAKNVFSHTCLLLELEDDLSTALSEAVTVDETDFLLAFTFSRTPYKKATCSIYIYIHTQNF